MRAAVVGHVEWGDFACVERARRAGVAAVYFTGGDAGALGAAGRARVLVATPRARGPLASAGVQLDALVHSASDPGERYVEGQVEPPPGAVVSTLGAAGGRWA